MGFPRGKEMVIITKKDAKKENIETSVICKFHLIHPDQQAIFESCEDCLIIHDDYGCDKDCFCSKCSQLKPDEFETKISGDKSSIEIRGYQVKNGILLTKEASLRLAEIIILEMKENV